MLPQRGEPHGAVVQQLLLHAQELLELLAGVGIGAQQQIEGAIQGYHLQGANRSAGASLESRIKP